MTNHDTQDLHPHTTTTSLDNHTRRFGRRALGAGISICAGTVIASETAAIISEQRMFNNRPAQLFAILTIVILMTSGGALVIVGGIERLGRPMRAQLRETALEQTRIRDTLNGVSTDAALRYTTVRDDLDERLALVMAHQTTVLGRLGTLEDGMKVLVELLPEEVQRQNWLGFNEAVKKGFTEQTGTDGSGRRRPPWIGLVPPGSEDHQP